MSDSRFPTGFGGPDPLHDRLDALRADVDRLPARPARLIRRRGNQRSLVQVAGTSLAAVSAIAVSAWVLPLGGSDTNQPVESPPTTTSLPTAPVVVPTLTDDALLGVGDLDELGLVADDGDPISWQIGSTHANPGLALSAVCLPRQSSPSATQSLARDYLTQELTGSPSDAVGVVSAAAEVIIVQPDAAVAGASLALVRDAMLACGQADDTRAVGTWRLSGVGDDGWMVDVIDPVPGSDVGLVHQIALGRSGPVVVGVVMTTISFEPPTPDTVLAALQSAMARLCQASGTTCPADQITGENVAVDPPEGESETPTNPGGGATGQLLDAADLPTWDGALPWDTQFDVPPEDMASGPYGTTCHPLWRDIGATTEMQRTYSVVAGSDPGDEPYATEVVAEFPDEPAAGEAMGAMASAFLACELTADDIALQVERISFDASAWQLTLPSSGAEADGRFLVGFVQVGSTTALVMIDYRFDDALPAAQFLELLELARQRLARALEQSSAAQG